MEYKINTEFDGRLKPTVIQDGVVEDNTVAKMAEREYQCRKLLGLTCNPIKYTEGIGAPPFHIHPYTQVSF